MDEAELTKRLDAIHKSLTKIHQWQADRPSGKELTLRMEEVLKTYGATVQLLEVWRRQLPEIQEIHRDVEQLHEVIADLEPLGQVVATLEQLQQAVADLERVVGELSQAVRAVGGEERG